MYAMYLRKSRSDNPEETMEETLYKHEKILFELVDKMKLDRNSIMQFKEVVSGETIESRPEMKKLLEFVMKGAFDGVLVVDVQRLARGDTMDQGTIIRAFSLNNTKIITPQKVVDPQNEYDQEYFEFDLFMGRREYKMINRRMQRGRHIAVQDGYYLGSIAPYGYNKIKLDKSYSLEFNENEIPTVKLIIDRYLNEDMGTATIANELNISSIPTRKSDRWTTSSVRTIIDNIHLYCGYIKWNSRKTVQVYQDNKIKKIRPRNNDTEYYNGKHPALFDQAILNAVIDKKKAKPTSKIPGNKEMKNQLSGIVVCANCGRKMVRRPYQNGRISTLICSTSQCKNVSSDLSIVENRIIKELETILSKFNDISDNYEDKNAHIIEGKKQQLNALNKEIEKLNKQLEKACEMLEIGAYTIDLFKTRENTLKSQIEATGERIEEINNDILNNTTEYFKKAIPILQQAITLYWEADTKQKNKILKSIIEKAIYKKEKSGRWNADAINEFELQLFLKI